MSKSHNLKSVMVHYKTSEREFELLKRMADMESRNWSEMLRELVREGAERRGLKILPLRSPLLMTCMTKRDN